MRGASHPGAHWGAGMFHSGTRVQYWGHGNHKLPFVLVDDVAEALMLGLDKPGLEGKSFLLTDAPLLSAREYVAALSQCTETQVRALPTPIWKFFRLDLLKEGAKNAIRHPNGKRPSNHDCTCRRHAARYDNRQTREALGWQPALTAMPWSNAASRLRLVTTSAEEACDPLRQAEQLNFTP
mgnify:CR=1 FL=1